MKDSKLKFIFASILTAFFNVSIAHADLSDVLNKEEIKTQIREELASLDVKASVDLGSTELFEGATLAGKYRYEVESSYLDQFYTRVDKWDLKSNINIGDIVDNFVELPFSFSIKNKNSFFFVRQFKSKKEALKSRPYSPLKLPLNAEKALENLVPGDFVSIPANLTVVVEAKATTATTAPVVLSANAKVYWIIDGEFTIQVFRIDQSRVRLKLIAKRESRTGISGAASLSFQFFSIKVVDKQVDRLFDRDLVEMGYQKNPGSQFIVDYVFDLSDKDARDAYDQILSSTYKFKNYSVLKKLDKNDSLQNKFISTYEKAEKLFEKDKNLPPSERRTSRIFKGFNDYEGYTKNIKLGLILTHYKKDKTFTENNISYLDKNNNKHEFFYPTFSKYIETENGKWIFELKDQSYQNYFGLIPTINKNEKSEKNPDFGLTFDRRDRRFRPSEQKAVKKFMLGQIPAQFEDQLDLSEWHNKGSKTDSKVYFQLILKSQGFAFLRNYEQKELEERLLKYAKDKSKFKIFNDTVNNTKWDQVKDFFSFNMPILQQDLKKTAKKIYDILNTTKNNPEELLSKLVKLNDNRVFEKLGVGFLISLLPPEQLKDLIYLKINITAKNVKAVTYEFGKLNHRVLYDELEKVQSRIATRTYDLRVTPEDYEMEELSEQTLTENE